MKISMNNYEAYLIDYMEGHLNAAEIQQLKAFCTQNNIDFDELTEDLPVLECSDDTFDEKEYLFKNKIVPFGSINEDNYAERFIAYQELLLDGEEEREVERFTEQNPFLARDLQTYGKCRLEPDTDIVFTDKDSLKKKAVILPLYAKMAAAVAVIVLLFGLFWLPKDENNDNNQQPVLVELAPEPDSGRRDVARNVSEALPNGNVEDVKNTTDGHVGNASENKQFASNGYDARNVSKNLQNISTKDVACKVSTRQGNDDNRCNTPISSETENEFLTETKIEEIQQVGLEPDLLVLLAPRTATEIEVSQDLVTETGQLPIRVFYLPMDGYCLAQNQEWGTNDDYDYYDRHRPSLIGRGIIWLSKGRYESIGEAVSDGLRIAKHEVVELSEQAVAAFYVKADESFGEAKARLEERFEREEE